MKPVLITAALFLACCLTGWAAVPMREPVRDTFDALEWNVVYGEDGTPRLTQLLGMDEGRVIHFWRMAKPGMYPRKDWRRGDWVSVFHDGGILREVRGKSFDERWEPGDWEVEQRVIVPPCQRRGLTPVGGGK